MCMILGLQLYSVNFEIVFLIFSSICCWYTLELTHRGNFIVYLQHAGPCSAFSSEPNCWSRGCELDPSPILSWRFIMQSFLQSTD